MLASTGLAAGEEGQPDRQETHAETEKLHNIADEDHLDASLKVQDPIQSSFYTFDGLSAEESGQIREAKAVENDGSGTERREDFGCGLEGLPESVAQSLPVDGQLPVEKPAQDAEVGNGDQCRSAAVEVLESLSVGSTKGHVPYIRRAAAMMKDAWSVSLSACKAQNSKPAPSPIAASASGQRKEVLWVHEVKVMLTAIADAHRYKMRSLEDAESESRDPPVKWFG